MDLASNAVIISICLGLLAFAPGGLGIYLIITSQRGKQKAQQSLNWPVVQGQVTEAKVRVGSYEYEESTRVDYIPEVHYLYQVGGQTYHGSKITFGAEPVFNSRQKAEAVLARYPLNGSVTVSYNPANPQESVLEHKASRTNLSMVYGIILVLVMVCMLCVVLFTLSDTLFPGR
jgi:hypothetical protein